LTNQVGATYAKIWMNADFTNLAHIYSSCACKEGLPNYACCFASSKLEDDRPSENLSISRLPHPSFSSKAKDDKAFEML